jgi:hypothetical protein
MLKQIGIVTVVSVTWLGAVMLPAHASTNQSDCAFAQSQLDKGVGPTGHEYNPYAATLLECSMQH